MPVSVAYDEASVVEFPFDAQRSLCDAPIDMRLCGPGLHKPSDRPVLAAALCCLMFYLFELMANASGFSAANQATQCLFRDGQ